MNSPALALSLVLLFSPSFPQSPSSSVTLPKKLHIRAVVEKTVDSKKAKPGDPVRMTVLAEELDGDNVVIAKGAKLYGKVLQAAPLGAPGSESKLSIVIERAEWKRHFVPLHAYVVAQGMLRTRVMTDWDYCNLYGRKGEPFGIDCAEAKNSGKMTLDVKNSPVVGDLELRRVNGEDGPTVLVSKRSNVVLRSETVVLLRNNLR